MLSTEALELLLLQATPIVHKRVWGHHRHHSPFPRLSKN